MSEPKRTDVKAALQRVLNEHQERLKTRNHWYTLAGLTESTGRSAFDGNPTIKTLSKLAEAAGMSLAEMLEYGDPDWEAKRRARAMVSPLSDEAAQGLVHLLEDRAARGNRAS